MLSYTWKNPEQNLNSQINWTILTLELQSPAKQRHFVFGGGLCVCVDCTVSQSVKAYRDWDCPISKRAVDTLQTAEDIAEEAAEAQRIAEEKAEAEIIHPW